MGEVLSSDLEKALSADTSAEELGKLSFHADPAVVEAVIANPRTPTWAVNRAKSRGTTTSSEPETPAPRGQTRAQPFEDPEVLKLLRQIVHETSETKNAARTVRNLLVAFIIVAAVAFLILVVILGAA